MSIPVRCSCGKSFVAPPHLAGGQAPCPYCGQFNWVTAGAARRPSVLPWLVGCLVLVCMFVICGGVAGVLLVRSVRTAMDAAGGGPMEVHNEDYAAARRGFQTKLVRRGPSPQDYDPLNTPDDAKLVYYQSGGRQLAAFVDPPPPQNVPRRPAVVFLHGGFAYGESDWDMARPFRDAGFLVMVPVLRGENGQGGDFTLFYDEVDDVLAAARELKKLPYVDANNVFVAGHSAGGTLAALSVLAADEFRAAASYSGTMNLSATIGHDPSLEVFDRSNPREVEMRSAEAYAGSFKSPMQLYYGSQEYFLRDGNKRTAEAARARGGDVRAITVPGDHFSSVPHAMRQSITFFRMHLDRRRPAPRGDLPTAEVADNTPSGTRSSPGTSSRPSTPSRPSTLPPRQPTRPPLRRPPTVPQMPIPPGSSIVIFHDVRYDGPGDAGAAARWALRSVSYANAFTANYDAVAEELTFALRFGRGLSFNSSQARAALQSAGFEVGGVTLKPGRR